MTLSSHQDELDGPGRDPSQGPRLFGLGSQDTGKVHTRGTHRLIAPEETVEKIRPHLKRFGITRVANITGLDTIGLPVIAVYRPNSRSLSVSQGKGLDLAAAKASGLMESIEGYHAEHVKLPLRLAHLNEMRDVGPVADVARLPQVSSTRFDPQRPVLWCEGEDLLSGERIWVPYEMVHTNYSFPLPQASGALQMNSNGLASGNHPLEAASHAICELVERDAITLWMVSGGSGNPARGIDLTTIDDDLCRNALALLEDAQQHVGVWSIASDIGLPVFYCLIADKTPNHLGAVYSSIGSGCHASKEIALLRALTEAAQTRLTYIAGARDDAHRDFFKAARNPELVRRHQNHILQLAETPCQSFQDVETFQTTSLASDVELQVSLLKKAGIDQAVAVNLGGLVPGIEVVRMVVPGLEGIHEAPGAMPGARARAELQRIKAAAQA